MNSQAFDFEHPLLADRDRLEQILDIMYARIQKELFPWAPRRRPRAETDRFRSTGRIELILDGTGVSADDVLSESLIALLEYPPDRLEGIWEALAVGIARHKALDAKTASKKGLRGTEHRPPLRLVSGDAERKGPDGDTEPSIFAVLPSDWGDPETEYFVIQGALKVRNIARELLDDRALKIFFAIHFEGYSRKEVGELLGLTSQRVGQIYNSALRSLKARPDYPFKGNN